MLCALYTTLSFQVWLFETQESSSFCPLVISFPSSFIYFLIEGWDKSTGDSNLAKVALWLNSLSNLELSDVLNDDNTLFIEYQLDIMSKQHHDPQQEWWYIDKNIDLPSVTNPYHCLWVCRIICMWSVSCADVTTTVSSWVNRRAIMADGGLSICLLVRAKNQHRELKMISTAKVKEDSSTILKW